LRARSDGRGDEGEEQNQGGPPVAAYPKAAAVQERRAVRAMSIGVRCAGGARYGAPAQWRWAASRA
jgi:hypothetical protein